MIRIVAAFLALAAAGCGAAPIAPTPPVPQPNHPAPIPPPPPPLLSLTRVVAFGDSMTEGQDGTPGLLGLFLDGPFRIIVQQPYPLRLQSKLNARYTTQMVNVTNRGKGGETTSDGLVRLPGTVQGDQPELVLLLEGVNDFNNPSGAALMASAAVNMDRMVKVCLAQNLKVMLAGIPPQRPGTQRGNSSTLVTPYNSALRGIAQANGVDFIDIEGAFGGDLSLIAADGLHPNAAGYERMAQAFYDRIVAKYELPPSSITSR